MKTILFLLILSCTVFSVRAQLVLLKTEALMPDKTSALQFKITEANFKASTISFRAENASIDGNLVVDGTRASLNVVPVAGIPNMKLHVLVNGKEAKTYTIDVLSFKIHLFLNGNQLADSSRMALADTLNGFQMDSRFEQFTEGVVFTTKKCVVTWARERRAMTSMELIGPVSNRSLSGFLTNIQSGYRLVIDVSEVEATDKEGKKTVYPVNYVWQIWMD